PYLSILPRTPRNCCGCRTSYTPHPPVSFDMPAACVCRGAARLSGVKEVDEVGLLRCGQVNRPSAIAPGATLTAPNDRELDDIRRRWHRGEAARRGEELLRPSMPGTCTRER